MIGMYHLSSDKISKYDLLTNINKTYKLDVEIGRDDSFLCDRSLNSDRLRNITNLQKRSWDEMILEMYDDYSSFMTQIYNKG